ncbi:MAG: GatB/YqeY domain-containing protein [Bacteroidia bacterium]
MDLETRINADIKQAMLAREKDKLEALRAVKSAVLMAKTEKVGVEMDEATEIKLLQKLVKQRKDSAAIYVEQNRSDLADAEDFQAGIIEAYLPAQLSQQEVEKIIIDVVSELGAVSVKEMGKVIAEASKRIAGRAEGKLIADLVKQKLT